jgi:hypothetical protein
MPASLAKRDSEFDRARFYNLEGEDYPSVTTILSVIDKPGLMHWAAKLEREAARDALLELLTRPGVTAMRPDELYQAFDQALAGRKAWVRKQDEAADIGRAAHALIEWHTRTMMNEPGLGPAPEVPDAALWAVEAWKDWCRQVRFTPLYVEQTVWCKACASAGTFDWIAKVEDIVTLGDIKTGRAIYPESYLQNVSYRHLARVMGMETARGMILRLPKVAKDPAFEARVVPTIPYGYFVSASRLWRWSRIVDGKKAGKSMTKCDAMTEAA